MEASFAKNHKISRIKSWIGSFPGKSELQEIKRSPAFLDKIFKEKNLEKNLKKYLNTANLNKTGFSKTHSKERFFKKTSFFIGGSIFFPSSINFF